ncbi:hypothetical protein MJG53_011656 [Ovis ammon polii x Ovis aries]|uniref:Uncharacterized protein n=1 Tax=Ovis ammon polii x Ovis aries TaxID=2918886 RepID=A0ACB9UPP0_9CETA|nr:hypothetical protein MJG53_011656 [Ovis ammon polii x Ovis aries]
MSVLTSPRGKVEVVHCRRTESQDIYCIKNLIRKFTQKLFGNLNIIYLLEKANLAITLHNDQEEIMAQATFLDYPNWNIATQDDWVSVFRELDSDIPCTPLNTLFMHLFVAVDEYSVGCCKEIIRTVFKAVLDLHFVFLIVPSCMSLGSTLITVFSQVGYVPSLTNDEEFAVHVCHRHNHYPQLHIRKARVEDHDNLMPIFLHHDTILKETYGEYFLAELIEAQDEENHAVVCEVEGVAVGFMSVCSQVNLELLHKCFDLGPFHGLCVPHQDDILEPPQEFSIHESSVLPQQLEPSDVLQFRNSRPRCHQCLLLCGHRSYLFCPSVTFSPKDSKLENSGEESQKIVKEPQEAVSLETRESIQRKGTEAAVEEALSPVTSENTGEVEDKDFCIISVPHLTPEFVLIQSFVKVVPFNNCTLEQDLYVFHRAGLLKTIEIRLATLSDTPGVEKLISTLMPCKSILEDLKQYNEARRDPDGTPLQVFVAEVAEQVVGIAVIRNEMDIEYIRSHYNIEDFIYFNHHQREEHGHLYHFVLNPIFRHYTKFFLKEILRLGYKSCLYYPVYPQVKEGKVQSPKAHSLTSALHYLVPVRPRRQIVYPLEKLGINAPSKEVSKDALSYALNHTNRKLSLEPKITVNAKIVVVGASNVGISFLETLVFCHCYNDRDHELMSLCSWVNVVAARMTAIDRAAKQVPCPTEVDISLHPTNREVSNSCLRRYTGPIPCNHFTLNDEEDCLRALAWIKNNSITTEGNVIIYGNSIDTYTTVETLLNLGVRGSCIHLVQHPPTSIITCTNDCAVEGAIEEALQAAGVNVYRDALLAQWNNGLYSDPIHTASFTTPAKPFQLPCSMFFSFLEKNVDYETFKAFNDACLVYDGRLVIDSNFHTNDIAIRAAGPLTKFSNRYYSNEWTHSNFNSKEIGFQLAAAMLKLFDPTLEPVTEPPADLDRLIPMYKGAKIKGGILPGSYHYLHVSKPAIPTPLEVQRAQSDFGSEIVTGNVKNGNYFRIHINKYRMVETITCLSKVPFPASNYIRLFGQHEQALNNLCARYEDGLVPDLYRNASGAQVTPVGLPDPEDVSYSETLSMKSNYFTEPWCMALFHDRFIDLRKALHQILSSKEDENLPSMEELARQIEDEEINLPEKPRNYLKRVFQETIYRPLVEKSILDYLHYNHYHLPMRLKKCSANCFSNSRETFLRPLGAVAANIALVYS